MLMLPLSLERGAALHLTWSTEGLINEQGHRLSAIQCTTAAGIWTALDLVAQGRLPQQGFDEQEAVALQEFLANRFGKAYAAKCLGELVAA